MATACSTPVNRPQSPISRVNIASTTSTGSSTRAITTCVWFFHHRCVRLHPTRQRSWGLAGHRGLGRPRGGDRIEFDRASATEVINSVFPSLKRKRRLTNPLLTLQVSKGSDQQCISEPEA